MIKEEQIKKQSCVKFQINYCTEFGYSVYIIGNARSLGNWQIKNALRMKWNENHNWTQTLNSTQIDEQDFQKRIEYKYCIAETNNPTSVSIWEEGNNRIFFFPRVSQICLQDVWNHIKLIFRLFEEKNANEVYVLGNYDDQGVFDQPQKMEKVIKTDYATQSQIIFWEKTIWVKSHKSKIKYNYAKKDDNQMLILDRQTRRFKMKQICNYNCLEINDNDFCITFTIDQIDDNLFIGPYPQSEEDIKQLKAKGIKAVLNLQTYKDMLVKGIKYLEMLKFYKKYQINPVNFPIIDMDIIDMCYKLQNVSRLLNYLVEQYKKVYVHCTAGIFRSSQTIIGYYTFYKKQKLSHSLKLLQKQHPISVVSVEYIEMVMNSTPVQISNSHDDLLDQDENQFKNKIMSPQESINIYKY